MASTVVCQKCHRRLAIPPDGWWIQCNGTLNGGLLCGTINVTPIMPGFKYCRFNCGGVRYHRVPEKTDYFECCPRCQVTYGISQRTVEILNGQCILDTFIPRGFDKICLDELKAAKETHAKVEAVLSGIIKQQASDLNRSTIVHQQLIEEKNQKEKNFHTQLTTEKRLTAVECQKALQRARKANESMEEQKKENLKLKNEIGLLKKQVAEKEDEAVKTTERDKEMVEDVKQLVAKLQAQGKELHQLVEEKEKLEKSSEEMRKLLEEKEKAIGAYEDMMKEVVEQLAKEKGKEQTLGYKLTEKDREIAGLKKSVEEMSAALHNMSSALNKCLADRLPVVNPVAESNPATEPEPSNVTLASHATEGTRKRRLETHGDIRTHGMWDNATDNLTTDPTMFPGLPKDAFTLENLATRFASMQKRFDNVQKAARQREERAAAQLIPTVAVKEEVVTDGELDEESYKAEIMALGDRGRQKKRPRRK